MMKVSRWASHYNLPSGWLYLRGNANEAAHTPLWISLSADSPAIFSRKGCTLTKECVQKCGIVRDVQEFPVFQQGLFNSEIGKIFRKSPLEKRILTHFLTPPLRAAWVTIRQAHHRHFFDYPNEKGDVQIHIAIVKDLDDTPPFKKPRRRKKAPAPTSPWVLGLRSS